MARRFQDELVEPLRNMAGKTIDVPAIALGLITPGVTIGERVAAAYRKHLFDSATLQELPDRPRFVFNATNLQSGVLWRFAKPYMRDYRVGEVKAPQVDLGTAVAASSAFPPFLSPVVLKLDEAAYTPGSGELQRAPFTTRPFLTDGGVYDNLGLETIWERYETILISDGGGHMKEQEKPKRLWPLHAFRVLGVIDSQVRVAAQAVGDRRLSGRPPERDLLGNLDEHRRLRPSVDAAVPSRRHAADRGDVDEARQDGRCRPGAAHQLGLRRLRRGVAPPRRACLARRRSVPLPGYRGRVAFSGLDGEELLLAWDAFIVYLTTGCTRSSLGCRQVRTERKGGRTWASRRSTT